MFARYLAETNCHIDEYESHHDPSCHIHTFSPLSLSCSWVHGLQIAHFISFSHHVPLFSIPCPIFPLPPVFCRSFSSRIYQYIYTTFLLNCKPPDIPSFPCGLRGQDPPVRILISLPLPFNQNLCYYLCQLMSTFPICPATFPESRGKFTVRFLALRYFHFIPDACADEGPTLFSLSPRSFPEGESRNRR